ncbi:MAG: hypothetical protein WC517_03545 [Patescibacteria group bacterium]
MLHRYLKLLSLAGLTLILALIGILGWHFLTIQAEEPTYDLIGWFWSDNYGWISLNSDNTGPLDHPYKVIVDSNNDISGWGWSDIAGWVCFGSTCDNNNICGSTTTPPCNDPNVNFGLAKPGGVWQAKIDPSTQRLTGWAKIISLMDSGWIHLGLGDGTNPGQSGAQCYDCQPKCDVFVKDDEGKDTSVCQEYSDDEYNRCNFCFTRTKFDNENLPYTIPSIDSVAGGSGNICSGCSVCSKILSSDQINSRIKCNACSSCNLYGGGRDSSNGSLLGWAWNGNTDGADGFSKEGAGWIQLNPKGGTGLVYPWLQTQFGNVYSSKDIRQKAAGSAGANATYCIFAQNISNFTSADCRPDILDVKFDFPLKSAVDSSYKNALGRLDLVGLSTVVKTSSNGSQKYNKYGNIVIISNGNQSWGALKALDNRVYVVNGNLVLSGSIVMENGTNIDNKRGNGLVIVNGDLEIENDIFYDIAVPGDLKQLASVAWVVEGDIRIKEDVKNIAGVFIALGEDGGECKINGASCGDSTDNYPKFDLNHYGVFSSGVSANPLTVSGLLMARAFNFERSYSSPGQGSEKIIYDGRLIANPPPGLKSLSEVLPVVRDFEF